MRDSGVGDWGSAVSHLICAPTLTDAWIDAVNFLGENGGEAFDLLVEVVDPDPSAGDTRVARELDAFLVRMGKHDTETVANTIFPEGLWRSSEDRDDLYERYRRLLARLHRLPGNGRGLYFERLIAYPLQPDPLKANQIERTILRLQDELPRSGLKHAYELEIHAPGIDSRPMGFPCLSALSFHVENAALRLAATYRNQYYIQKALGNLLGLARLQAFVAGQVGVPVAALSVHAFHAQVDPGVGKAEFTGLMSALPSRAADHGAQR